MGRNINQKFSFDTLKWDVLDWHISAGKEKAIGREVQL